MRPAAAVTVSLLAVVACGDIGTSLDSDGGLGSPVDATADADSGPDAGGRSDAGQTACVWGKPSPDPFAQVNGPDHEESATLSGDGLTVFFTRFPVEGQDFTTDVFDATREAVDKPFSAARPVTEVSKAKENEIELEISGDGQEIFFVRSSDDILSASRPVPGAAFGEVTATGLFGFSPTVSGDRLALYFIDLDFTRILRATRTAIGEPWNTPVDVGGLGSFDTIDVSADERRMLLSQPADGVSQTVAIATRETADDPFGAPVSAGDVFRVEDDVASYVHATWDASGRQIVVTVELADTDTGADLYLSTCQ
jgi:hypothetical protein